MLETVRTLSAAMPLHSVRMPPGSMTMTLMVCHEALCDRTGVKGPRRRAVAAAGMKLEEA